MVMFVPGESAWDHMVDDSPIKQYELYQGKQAAET